MHLKIACINIFRSISSVFTHQMPEEQTPLRAELLSSERLAQHAKKIAEFHSINPAHRKHDLLLKRLDANEKVLRETSKILTDAVRKKQGIAPAGEWLLDNFYLIEEQIRTARRHLPKGYSLELPCLGQDNACGLPRVYDIALNAIAHGDGHIDGETLGRFVASYQSVAQLSLGELWAVPIMLRLALIENLRRVSTRITIARKHLVRAQMWANQMLEAAERDPKNLILVIADMARSEPPMASAFVAEITRQLQGHGPTLALALTWLEQRLAESSQTIEHMVLSENQKQAADQVSISNSIGSLRRLAAMDWRDFVETHSEVEQVLRQDPEGIYGAMDFATRDQYRHVIGRLARRSGLSESAIARQAIDLAKHPTPDEASPAREPHARQAHVGFYLIDRGLPILEKAIGVQRSLLMRLIGARGSRRSLMAYLGGIGALSAIFTAFVLVLIAPALSVNWVMVLLIGAAVVASSQLASALVNWVITLFKAPDRLPRMDYAKGIPPSRQTLIVVPTLLSSPPIIEQLLKTVEVCFLSNRDAHLHFALLTDFRDAPQQCQPDDEALLNQVRLGIEQLNQKYSRGLAVQGDRFFLLHRPRLWNRHEALWMGYERKRGKLADLNALLRGKHRDRFSLMIGDVDILQSVKYVITLDTDTLLPRDAARQLVATMAHPLNHPVYDHKNRVIRRGYGILQPRIAANLSEENPSRYAQLFGEEPGIDPYTRAVSNVYQDLFGEGSFIGKGIYDVDAFEFALGDRLPENRILSHDLLEGCYVRSGLISDVYLYEAYPSRYDLDMLRRERWIRGDWQIAQWVLPSVPARQGRNKRNPLSLLSRWKIFDNLRRSIEPVAYLLLFTVGWWVAPNAMVWTLVILSGFFLPPLLAGLVDSFRKPNDRLLHDHLRSVLQTTVRGLCQAGFRLTCLPYEAISHLVSMSRSISRVLLNSRGLLDWCSYVEQRHLCGSRWAGSYCTMWSAPLISVVMVPVVFFSKHTIFIATPVLTLWFFSPVICCFLSLRRSHHAPKLEAAQIKFLHRLARKYWAYFEHFATNDDNWLIVDNFQVEPEAKVAHRTSPTNIGMSLLANVSAHDFGYLPATGLVLRTTQCFSSLDKLERSRGHFYNWYDTRTLAPLPPRYISTVDSGNLAGHLLTLRVALDALPTQKIPHPQLFHGLTTTLEIVSESVSASNTQLPSHDVASTEIEATVERLQTVLQKVATDPPMTLVQIKHALCCLSDSAADLLAGLNTDSNTDLAYWSDAFYRQCQTALNEITRLAPWLRLPAPPASLRNFIPDCQPCSLNQFAAFHVTLLCAIEAQLQSTLTPIESRWLTDLYDLTQAAVNDTQKTIQACNQLAQRALVFSQMEYAFLYDTTRHLLAIGYNVDEQRRDDSYYDLLASEARLGNFVAIAQGQLPEESWFALGRSITALGHDQVLISWSGSMFEYLMPTLIMPSYKGSLLHQTCRSAVKRQIAYGNQHGVPWGVSESGYHMVDANLNYQYHAFGVPGLGLKRGLTEDLVIAPYASALALLVAPEAACANLQRLSALGVAGRFGLYEAIDYTPARLPRGQNKAVVRSFMAHHQGMSLLALAFQLLEQPMQKRFESDPMLQSALLLLQERVPKVSVLESAHGDLVENDALFRQAPVVSHEPIGADTPVPEVQLLSNGRYHVMLTNAGGGYSRWNGFAVTRWREDVTCDNWGLFIYVRDTDTGRFWSATHQPTLAAADTYEAVFSEGRAEYRRRDLGIETYSQVVVSPEDDIELRRVRITNRSSGPRALEVTTYAEVAIAPPAADMTQPGFSNLFVQTEILADGQAILCTRRPRSAGEKILWMFHLLAQPSDGEGQRTYAMSSTTDRMAFIGRGRTLVAPQALIKQGALSGSSGSVLDPIVAIRCPLALSAGKGLTLDIVTGMAESRAACLALIAKYQDRPMADRVLNLAWTHSSMILHQINALEAEAHLYRRLASSIVYANGTLRADPTVIKQNQRGQSGLWGYAISGDLPIVLLKLSSSEHIQLAKQLIQCHAYWRLKGLIVDLVIWNEDQIGYRQALHDQIMGLIATGTEAHTIDRPGGIFVRSAEQISNEDRVLLLSVSRAIISDQLGSLATQVNRRRLTEKSIPLLTPTFPLTPYRDPLPPKRQDLLMDNGLGGFNKAGNEYVITTTTTDQTPAPWINVLANPHFGSVVSENGLAYTWYENAHEYRLTPWHCDNIGAGSGEAFYIRDEDSGYFWSPAPMPCRGKTPYVTRHGFGYSIFEHSETGISSELCLYVDLDDSIKFSVIKLRNQSGQKRRLSVTGYVEWVLSEDRSKSAMHVVTEIDKVSGALLARNAFNTEFQGHVAFFDVSNIDRKLTGDRGEFIGRNGSLQQPAAMRKTTLSGRMGPALDPCGAIQVPILLDVGQERTLVFRLGAGHSLAQTRALALKFRPHGSAQKALEKVRRYWKQTLNTVQVNTPDAALNLLANGWLVYQTLACRFWARSGYYQSGGAFGFRDQLQDAMALIHAQPKLLRDHLLLCASRQYPEGDVQHWWHPPAGRGVRTRCSDDYLWLPLATCRYVLTTGDTGVLHEDVPFIEGRRLNADEESYYDLPHTSSETTSLYQHCVRCIEHGLRFGEKGLPLMGSGDWNDGLSRVGISGKGESVWLGFFLYHVLISFARVADLFSDPTFAERCRTHAQQLQINLEKHGWDGDWYCRAWFDDGTPLGSATNIECRIDSIAQSWSVLSGAADQKRSRVAMAAVEERLVRRADKLIQLLDPPFDTSDMQPGYIKGYVPGVRENGGQYTHAAIWTTMAFAQLGDAQRAWSLMNLINPILHGNSKHDIETYKVEPYVIAADVYAVAPHSGRGGWSWYTGSAGWMYRLILESLLGLSREENALKFKPCLPAHWTTYSIDYCFGRAQYHIIIKQVAGDSNISQTTLTLDGRAIDLDYIPLVDEKRSHTVELVVYKTKQARTAAPSDRSETVIQTIDAQK